MNPVTYECVISHIDESYMNESCHKWKTSMFGLVLANSRARSMTYKSACACIRVCVSACVGVGVRVFVCK